MAILIMHSSYCSSESHVSCAPHLTISVSQQSPQKTCAHLAPECCRGWDVPSGWNKAICLTLCKVNHKNFGISLLTLIIQE